MCDQAMCCGSDKVDPHMEVYILPFCSRTCTLPTDWAKPLGNSYKWSLLRFLYLSNGQHRRFNSFHTGTHSNSLQCKAIHLHRQGENPTQKEQLPWSLNILVCSCSSLSFNHREEEWAFQLSRKVSWGGGWNLRQMVSFWWKLTGWKATWAFSFSDFSISFYLVLYLLSILTTGLSAFYLCEGGTVCFFLLPFSIYLFLFLRLVTQLGCEFLLLFPPTGTCRTADYSELGEPLHPRQKKNSSEVLFFKFQDFSGSLVISDSMTYWC